MNQPRAFGNIQPVQQESAPEESFVETLFGSAAESFVSNVSMGMWNPDIVSDEAQANSRIASTIGNVAGTIAGFIPSFGATSVAAKALMGTFKFSKKILDASNAMTKAAGLTDNAAKFTRAFKPLALRGLNDAVPSFILYDVSKEFIRQTKENDPDLEALGKVAIRGGLTGFFTGSAAVGFALEKPITQALAMGSSMALAETINDASDGEDVLSAEYFRNSVLPNFAIGMALGAVGSRGYEGRRAAFGKDAQAQGEAFMNSQIKSMDIKTKAITYKDPYEELEINGVFKKLMEIDPVNKPEYQFVNRKLKDTIFGSADRIRTAQNRTHKYKADAKLTDEEYQSFLKNATGKTSTKEMDRKDYVLIETELRQKAANYNDAKTQILEKFGGIRPAGFVESYFSPADAIMNHAGMRELTNALRLNALQAKTEHEVIGSYVSSIMKMWDDSVTEGIKKGTYKRITETPVNPKVGIAPKAFGKFVDLFAGKKTNMDSRAELEQRIQTGNTQGLSGEGLKAFNDYTRLLDFFRDRSNQVLRAMGKPEINRLDFYMHHATDREALAMAGVKRSDMPKRAVEESQRPIYAPNARVPFNPNRIEPPQMKRVDESNVPYKKDPEIALMNMIKHDLKIIYLHEPLKILDADINKLIRVGAMPKQAKDTIGKFVNQHIYEQPTEKTNTLNAQITRWLEEGAVGKVVDKFMLDSGHWLGDSPVNAFASMWGAGTTKAFLALNPKMSMLNMLQFINVHGMVESKYIAKGMMGREAQPKRFRELFDESIYTRNALGKGMEYQNAEKGAIGKTGMHTFQASTNIAIENTWYSAAHSIMDKLTNPNKFKEGWQDLQGKQIRAKMMSRVGTNKELPTDKDWNTFLTKDELARFKTETDHITDSVNFLYNAVGSTAVMRSAITRPFFALTSFPMNYFYKYITELYTRAKTGQPGWAKGTNIKLPITEQYGIVKHLVLLGGFTAILAKTTDLDYNKMSGTSLPFGLKEGGVMSFAPSPAMTLFGGIMDSFSTDPRTAAEGRSAWLRSIPIPYAGAARQVSKVVEGKKENVDFLFYRKRQKQSTTKSGAFAYKGYQGYKPFKD
jgi:hypothetical protein